MFMSPPELKHLDSVLTREPATQDHDIAERTLQYQNSRIQDLPEVIVRDLNNYGLCVLDDFLGEDRAQRVHAEVLQLQAEGKFSDGKIANPRSGKAEDVRDIREIRGDKIAWISGREPGCSNIAYLINQVA